MEFLTDLNHQYIEHHTRKEQAFWHSKMALKGYSSGTLEKFDREMAEFCADGKKLQAIEGHLLRQETSRDERLALEGWRRFFACYVSEKSEALPLQKDLIKLEGEIQRKRQDMALGYKDPKTGAFVAAGYGKLSLLALTDKDEALRRAAYHGLRDVETFVLDNGFIEIIKKRNHLGRLLGFDDYYDYKVTQNEGFGKSTLFEILDDLEIKTRDVAKRHVKQVVKERGAGALEPWNYNYFTVGDVLAKLDRHFPFNEAVMRWGRSFAALGIKYNGATLTLDLVNRQGKYENGFMHGPFPGYVDRGTYRPAAINFTANAIPGQVGSGLSATNTLFHEGGHAAHFANIFMPAPCFSQEFAPTSVAFAETQSMFLDSLISDPDWRARYALDAAGNRIPKDLMSESLTLNHEKISDKLRAMLAVSYTEKALYELRDDQLTAEKILEITRDIERKMRFLHAGTRPVLSIPHLISGEASAYYHGYILAQMGVYQTRNYFMKKYGHILDNPRVGPELAENYWQPGNSKTFLEFVEDLTGSPFSADATAELANKSVEQVVREAEVAMANEKNIKRANGKIDLDAKIALIHGDELVANSDQGFEAMANKFGDWIDHLKNE
jgi:Zn-dependent oligopeptidase